MSQTRRAVRDYTIMVGVTLLVVELVSFGVLVGRSASAPDVTLGQAVSARLRQHPWCDKGVRELKQDSEYVYFPTTQYAFRANTTFSTLRVGRHGFIPNGDADPADFPGKPPGLVRVVMLGGSSMAGATASANDKTIPARLEALLAETGGGARFQVLNFGMGSNYSYGELTRLITEVAYLEPDAVVLLDGYNDAHYANLEHVRAELSAPLMNWADYSYQYFDTWRACAGRCARRRPS